MVDRNRPARTYTLAPDVVAYLDQDHINASRLVEAAVREKVADHAIADAASRAGVEQEDADR